MKNGGTVLCWIGGLILLFSFGYDTAPTGTHNLGLLQTQMMLCHLGIGVFIVGAIFTGFGRVLEKLGTETDSEAVSDDTKAEMA